MTQFTAAQQQTLLDAAHLRAQRRLYAEAGAHILQDQDDSESDEEQDDCDKRHQRIFDDDEEEDCEGASQEDEVSDLSSGQEAYEVDEDEPSEDEVYADEDDDQDANDKSSSADKLENDEISTMEKLMKETNLITKLDELDLEDIGDVIDNTKENDLKDNSNGTAKDMQLFD